MGKCRLKIVVSAINFFQGGPLTVLKSCLMHLSNNLSKDYEIIALVHKKELFNIPNITYYEFIDSRGSWLRRLYYEYIYFKKLSKKIKPYLWLSLHDITPSVESDVRAVYCHNPASFYPSQFKAIFLEPKFLLFNLFYKYLYRINIKKNNFIIVQQDWLRQKLAKLCNISKAKIIVSCPSIYDNVGLKVKSEVVEKNNDFIFFYPAFPRFFKNFEVICEAVKILADKGVSGFKVYLTIDGDENRYSRSIYNKYNRVENINFVGLLRGDEVHDYYNRAGCLIFPSKLETWGLPITEFKNYKKPILLANKKYAHETIGDYDKVIFFDPDKASELSRLMEAMVMGNIAFEKTKKINIKEPFAADWDDLFKKLLKRCQGRQSM